jgi:uncharacterized protein (DUF169 family)
MNNRTRDEFLGKWKRYFGNAELPITFYYTDEEGRAELAKRASGHECIIDTLSRVRSGESLAFSANSLGCFGARRYLGFTEKMGPDFEYFLSCGIPGKLEGERYKKSPELVRAMLRNAPKFKAPGKYIVFKRWDKLKEIDEPEVVIFFAKFDVLSGLFTLANFDEVDSNGVISPFGSGCNSIVQYPFLEKDKPEPRAILGMFDVSARPYVGENVLTLAIPFAKFKRMVDNMDESFLITESWKEVLRRINRKT